MNPAPSVDTLIAATKQIGEAIHTAAESARRAFNNLAAALKQATYDAKRDMHCRGGHWYPAEHMPMTARQYRTWKRRQQRRRA